MTDAVQIELIRALAIIPGSIGGIVAAWFSYKAAIHAKEAVDVAKNVEQNTNGMSHALNDLTEKSSYAAGRLFERNLVKKDPEGKE
jgi:hypothetical protein